MDLNVNQLKEKIDKGEDFVLIDVREPHEHEEFNVGGQLIPLGTIATKIAELEDRKDQEVVVYCRSGGRSGMAQQLLIQSGFKNVKNLTGGMLAWQDAFGK
ncbi:MAG: hypothetical protein DHS20C18_52530 [Saprospiraceae bacterium]|nr:MAG: hypothetical protein DHS20C18_52530 [Saprospiraceae bacterium]